MNVHEISTPLRS